MPRFVSRWRSAWRLRDFRDQLLVSLIGLLIAALLMLVFLDYFETRTGVILNDPLLSLFSPVDLRWITYSFIYSGLLLGLASLSLYPFTLLLALRAFVAMTVLRMVCLFLLPLDPPSGMIPFLDPYMQIPGVPPVFTRDLFFSWQIAVMSIFVYTAQWRDMKIIFSAVGFVVAVLLLVQHVHYSIDLFGAPCFAYVAYGIAKWLTIEEVQTSADRGNKPAGINRPMGNKGEQQKHSMFSVR
jgi:hypothetical protein